MIKMITLKDNSIKDAIWRLTCAANNLKGFNDYDDIQKDILVIRDKLRKVYENE